MPTLKQLSTSIFRKKKVRRSKVKALLGGPQRKAIVVEFLTRHPRKPNSATRPVVKVIIITNQKELYCHLPGLDRGLNMNAVVLVEGKGSKDLPGINYSLIRGALTYTKFEIYGRSNKRSKFGSPKVERVRHDDNAMKPFEISDVWKTPNNTEEQYAFLDYLYL